MIVGLDLGTTGAMTTTADRGVTTATRPEDPPTGGTSRTGATRAHRRRRAGRRHRWTTTRFLF
jgi:hypothetical protein